MTDQTTRNYFMVDDDSSSGGAERPESHMESTVAVVCVPTPGTSVSAVGAQPTGGLGQTEPQQRDLTPGHSSPP